MRWEVLSMGVTKGGEENFPPSSSVVSNLDPRLSLLGESCVVSVVTSRNPRKVTSRSIVRQLAMF